MNPCCMAYKYIHTLVQFYTAHIYCNEDIEYEDHTPWLFSTKET